jgi:hypothetical protein
MRGRFSYFTGYLMLLVLALALGGAPASNAGQGKGKVKKACKECQNRAASSGGACSALVQQCQAGDLASCQLIQPCLNQACSLECPQ